ncbi:MAG TPA: N-6 DNA methylase [Tepidimicrobium sp.]|nr:N-6 DNA methylase [Tepidimicrobium sp.]
MDSKIKIIEDTFGQEYNYNRYLYFMVNFLKEPRTFKKRRDIRIWKEFSNSISAYYKLGDYVDDEGMGLLILAVELKRGSTVERARSLQRNFISKILNGSNYEGAMVAFYTPGEDNWRLSFVRLDYKLTDKGLKLELTPARRYSYLVGENEPTHTAQKRLLEILKEDEKKPSIQDIERAFSVEKVTDDFFEQYKEKYLQLKEYLEDNDDFIKETKKLGLDIEKFSEQFSKKLMGQISFLYFLQKKGWLGVTILPRNRMLKVEDYEDIIRNLDSNQKRILDRIFCFDKVKNAYIMNMDEFENLSEQEAIDLSSCFKGTKFDMPWGTGKKKFIRELFDFCEEETGLYFFNDYLEPFFYEALNTKRKNNYYKRFNCKIPFLNGGLFEPLEGYHWKDVNFRIPNEIFSNRTEKGDYADGILDIFDRYNFTINEAEPLEKEVAVDPEMLGKVFENLLDVSSRKSKGAFYTPRKIVHFMCQEALINYISNEVDVPYEDIKQFILYGELMRDQDNTRIAEGTKDYIIPKSIYDNILPIDRALDNVRIADPAVGSGAFPLGMLTEIVNAKNNITEYVIKRDKEGIFGKKYGEEFIRNWRSSYKIKWETIKDCIYAVDIEASAVDITKLRLWLSLVVDQELKEGEDPHPLPNLDMNIHVGNSLIDEYEGIKLFDKSILKKQNGYKKTDETEQLRLFFDSDEILEELFQKQNQYFEEYDEIRRKSLKESIDNLQDQLILQRLRETENHEDIAKYEEVKNDRSKPFFIWELEFAKVFKEKNGFDIVIGNPPYIDSEEMTKKTPELREYCRKQYDSAKGNWDIYIIFVEKGLKLLKTDGIISYIVPNKIIGAKYSEGLRKIIKEYSVKEIVDFSSVDIFKSADVYPIVFRIEKSLKKENVNMVIMRDKENILSEHEIKHEIFYRDIYWDRYLVKDREVLSIIEKVLTGESLDSYCSVKGAATVSEAYDIKEKLLDANYTQEYKKFINTGTIDRYISLWGNKKTRYIKSNYLKPIIRKDDLSQINQTRLNESDSKKIIVGGMNKYLECFYDNKAEYLAGKSTTILYDFDTEPYYLLGLLNSKLISFFYKTYFKSLSLKGGYLRIGPPQLKEIPILIDKTYMDEIINKTEKLSELYIMGKDQQIASYENRINELVYKVYNLNNSEVIYIENKISNFEN